MRHGAGAGVNFLTGAGIKKVAPINSGVNNSLWAT